MPRILVIEDEILLRENVLDLLDNEGFEVFGAENGRIGVELAQAHLPDLILCDILMPELNGYDVLATLRENASTALIPFIFLTAKGTTVDFRQGMNLGADDYLTKPYNLLDLLKAITNRLEKQALVLNLKQTIEELEQSNLLKEKFLDTASQEMRKPITNIAMALKMLQNAPNRERQQRYIELLQAECFREIELINNLLELQRLKTNSRSLRLERLSLQEWIPLLVEVIRPKLHERQQTIQASIPPYLPALLVDHADLKWILTELLTNAHKYTAAKGKIILEVQRLPASPSQDSSPSTMFLVSNEAEIPVEALPHVFDEFYRVPSGDRWQQGGSGLGLFLAKQLVERLGGMIQVTSEAGWTQFIVQLPLQPVA